METKVLAHFTLDNGISTAEAGHSVKKQGGGVKKPERFSIISTIMLLLFIGLLTCSILYIIFPLSDKNDLCLTPHCVMTASRILESMDRSVDPCQNFYEFSCGSWHRMHEIPDDKHTINTFDILDYTLSRSLKSLLESPLTNDTRHFERHVKDFYTSCLNLDHINEIGNRPILDLLEEFGGFPILEENWKGKDANLTNLLIKTTLQTRGILFKVNVITNSMDTNRFVLLVGQPDLTFKLTKSYYIDKNMSKVLDKLEEVLAQTVTTLQPNNSNVEQEIRELLNFEIQLANITGRKDMVNSYATTLRNFSDLFRKMVDFERLVITIFGHVNITMDSDETVVVQAASYTENLGKILEKTPEKTIFNYVVWQVLANFYPYLPQKFLDLMQDFVKVLSGTLKEEPRWKFCTKQTSANFGMMLGSMYVKKYFNPKAKENAVGIIKGLKDAFARIIKESLWMSEETKRVAIEKIYAIHDNIAYPGYILNESAFLDDLKNYRTSSTEFLENRRKAQYFKKLRNLAQLRNKVDRTRWRVHPAEINAFYISNWNQIAFPAGILQSPFYHGDSPMYLNFGGIGTVIGHEITHGFDDIGKYYDKDGNLKNWWSIGENLRFRTLEKCIIDQYSNYTVEEINQNLDGTMTISENIADNGGLKQSFKAYEAWVEKNGAEKSLPGLDYTPHQLFFINYGQIFCGSTRPQYAMKLLKTSGHAPRYLRLKGTLVNSKEFAKVFNCPRGSPLNPASKCSIW